MATRTITTKLALDGETEYKAKLQSVNAEIRVHQSELERVRAEYAGQLNSLAALQAQEAALGGQLEAVGRKYDEQAAMLEKAQEAQELYRVKAAALQRQLDIMAHSAGDTTEAEAELTKKLKEATTNMQRAAFFPGYLLKIRYAPDLVFQNHWPFLRAAFYPKCRHLR